MGTFPKLPKDHCPYCFRKLTLETRHVDGLPEEHYICLNLLSDGKPCGFARAVYTGADER